MASNMILLEEAARQGKIDVLHNLLKENPSILDDYKLISLSENLLHVATKSGQLHFVHELMKIDPHIVEEMNKDGFRALDIAVIMGNTEIVKEIISYNQHLCRLKGKEQRTALHYAVIKGRIDVIDELLHTCPDCILDVTVHGENAIHLAVKYYQFDAFATLVKWLERLMIKERMVTMEDGDGNTVLDIAASTKQHECIDLLLNESSNTGVTIQVNAKNAEGLTAQGILDIQDSHDIQLRQQKLEHATRSKKVLEPSENWFEYFKFQKKRDSPSNTRNALLVVAALIATVCFQAGTNPPTGIILNKNPPDQRRTFIGPAVGSGLAAASAVLGSHASSFLFLFANTLALTSSTCIIIYLTSGFPFQMELHVALYSMMLTYGFAISSVIKGMEMKKESTAYVVVTVACVVPFAWRWVPRWGKKAWKYWRNR